MKKTIFAILIAFGGSVMLSVAQPGKRGEANKVKDPKQVEVAIAKRVAEMKVRLSLSDKQAAEMTKIFTQAHAARIAQADAMRERAKKERDEMKAQRDEQKAQIEAVLTTTQKAEFVKMHSEAPASGFYAKGAPHFKKQKSPKSQAMGRAKGAGMGQRPACVDCSCSKSVAPGVRHKGAHRGVAPKESLTSDKVATSK